MTSDGKLETPVLLKPEIFDDSYSEGSEVYSLR